MSVDITWMPTRLSLGDWSFGPIEVQAASSTSAVDSTSARTRFHMDISSGTPAGNGTAAQPDRDAPRSIDAVTSATPPSVT